MQIVQFILYENRRELATRPIICYILFMAGQEVFRVGPFDIHPDTSHMDTQGGYREDRSIAAIEEELARAGFPFSFEEHLRYLSAKFSSTPILYIVESGCGEARALKDVKDLGTKLHIPIHTTGITLAERNIVAVQQMGVDNVILGSVENAFAREMLPGQVHFFLDFYGASFYSPESRINGELYLGLEAARIYAAQLAPGGTALVTNDFLNPKLAEYWGSGPRERTIAQFHQLGFEIIGEGGCFALLEKTTTAQLSS